MEQILPIEERRRRPRRQLPGAAARAFVSCWLTARS